MRRTANGTEGARAEGEALRAIHLYSSNKERKNRNLNGEEEARQNDRSPHCSF